MKDLADKKIAIVHDWLVGGGAELVVLELHHMFPDAPIYTSYCSEEWRQNLDDKVVTGYLQYWPFSKLRKFLPVLRLWWFRSLDLSDYDLVISSSGNGEAKTVRVPKGSKHICYCHAPVHFYWRHYDQYMENPGFGIFNPLARLGLKLLASRLRRADYEATQRVDQFIANSTHTQTEIKKYYSRDSVVIHPPVDIERFQNAPKVPRHGFITAGRLVPYKRTEIIVQACTELNLPLRVVGTGPELKKLQAMAGPSIEFLGWVRDDEMPGLFASAEAFIFAAYEDFGITPVEAMAAGTPVIAYKAGGALDYVIEGKTGMFFSEQTADSLIQTLKQFNHQPFTQAENSFSARQFQENLQAFLSKI